MKEHDRPGLRSAFSIERIVEARRQCGKEISYYISSCDSSANRLMELAREHWKIESMHWVLDVTFSEDSCRFLCENAHKSMNALRKFSLAVHKNFLAASHKKTSLKVSMLFWTLMSYFPSYGFYETGVVQIQCGIYSSMSCVLNYLCHSFWMTSFCFLVAAG